MDEAHRLVQTEQVTVYRLICKGTIEERILQRAREKRKIQRMVISGGNFKPDTLKPKEVVSLLCDNDENEAKYRQKKVERMFLKRQYLELKIHHKNVVVLNRHQNHCLYRLILFQMKSWSIQNSFISGNTTYFLTISFILFLSVRISIYNVRDF